MKNFFPACLGLLSLSLACAGSAAPVSMQKTEAGNLYVGGSEVAVTAPVDANLYGAGANVRLESRIGKDAALAGGKVEVRAPVGQDVRAAGGTVDIGADIGGDLVAAGGTIRLESPAAVAGEAMLAGGDVTLAGRVAKGARIYAGKITLTGEIDGDARFYGKQINLMPQARIKGNLFYASPEPLPPDSAALVSGTITREPGRGWSREPARPVSLSWLYLVSIFSMLVSGMLLSLLFPNAVAGAQRALQEFPLRSLLIGLALLFAIPPVAILFMLTVIGIPIGFTLLALYPLMLLLGFLGAAFFIGRRAADALQQPRELGFLRQALFLALALIIFNLVALIPFLGMLILFLLLVAGIGGWAVAMHMRYRMPRRALDSDQPAAPS